MARGTCGDCARSPPFSTKTSLFSFSMFSWCIPRWPGAGCVKSLGVLHVLLTLSLRLLTSLLVLLFPPVGDALVLPAVGFARLLFFFFIIFSSAHSDSVL